MGIISTVNEISINEAKAENITFQLLKLERFEIASGDFGQLTFNDLRVDTLSMLSTKVTSGFLIKNSHFGEYGEYQNDHYQCQIYDTEFTGYYQLSDVNINTMFWVYDSQFKEGAHLDLFRLLHGGNHI
jgi:hypothetical protein